jgi:hypothetical protein
MSYLRGARANADRNPEFESPGPVARPQVEAGVSAERFVPDPPLEGTEFEPSVPRQEKWSMPSSSDQTRVGRTLTLGGGAESSQEGRDIELSVSPAKSQQRTGSVGLEHVGPAAPRNRGATSAERLRPSRGATAAPSKGSTAGTGSPGGCSWRQGVARGYRPALFRLIIGGRSVRSSAESDLDIV